MDESNFAINDSLKFYNFTFMRDFTKGDDASMAERLTHVPRVREVWISNPGPAKSYTALQTVCHRFNI